MAAGRKSGKRERAKARGEKEDRGAGDLSFEKCLARLERIVDDLEAGEVPLEKSLALYEEGVKLLREAHRRLEEAEKKIRLLVRTGGGFRLKGLGAGGEDGEGDEEGGEPAGEEGGGDE